MSARLPTDPSDVWNTMLRSRTHGLTLHRLAAPPPVVLDLGCGCGYWALEAAKAWPNSVVVGFDARAVQPDLLQSFVRSHHRDIAHRVKWVHGDLLDPLPFHSNYFDLVRVVNVGLGVPENKVRPPPAPRAVLTRLQWGHVLEARIHLSCQSPTDALPGSRPRAQARRPHRGTRAPRRPCMLTRPQVIEEDPIFPCHVRRPLLPKDSSLTLVNRSSPALRPATPQDRSSDLQDHSRLRAAWLAMLAARAVAVDVLAVLPFHLTRLFADVRCLPPLHVLLPANSSSSTGSPALVRSCSASTSSSRWDTATLVPAGDSADHYTTEFAQMHLASTVHVVAACKEDIWHEYKKLFDANVAKVVHKNASAPSGHTASSGPGNIKSSIRESFDDEWAAWFNDMTDRIGMRTLMSQLSWDEPPGQRPDWHVWRAKVQQFADPADVFAGKPPALCRSIHGFVARKRQP
ncbi:hypothetical protein C0993_000125 [Termitomyces sp. T159_Od127]|nr:hypothetical protein C0993_000125 [Termitomyces sp. T159_Od127]